MVKIRQADQHDFRGCLECVPLEWRTAGFEARLGVQLWKDYIFVAEDDNKKIVGYLACDSEFFDADGFYLRTMLVHELSRRQGIGSELINTATKWAFSRGVRRVFVDVPDKGWARNLQKAGFEKVGEVKHLHAENVVYEVYSLKAASPVY
jgi:GNAT superfamily N-acetyltransferase